MASGPPSPPAKRRFSPPVAIAHITPSYLPNLGGKETYIYDIVQGLPEFRFLVLAGRVWGLRIPDQDGRIRVVRVGPPDLFRGPRALSSPARAELLLGGCLSVVRLDRQRALAEVSEASVIHSHWSDIEFADALRGIASEEGRRRFVARALRVATFRKPTVFTDHSMFLVTLSDSERQLLEHALRTYDTVICVEPEGADRARTMKKTVGGSARVEFIPNSVDCATFRPAYEVERVPVVGFLGRANKGYHLIFDLIVRLREFRFLLIVAGDRRSLKKWRAIVSERVKLVENALPWDLPRILRGCDVVVNPILLPGISRVTLEALACGIPVVAAAGSGRYPLVDGKTGFLLPPCTESFGHAVRDLLQDERMRQEFGAEGRRIVEAEFSDSVVLPRLRATYERLAA